MNKNILIAFGIKFLFLGVIIAPSIYAYMDEEIQNSEFVEITTNVNYIKNSRSSIILPESSLIYIEAPSFNLSMNHTIYHWINSWSGKPFLRNTLMFIGSGVGFRQNMFVRIYVTAH